MENNMSCGQVITQSEYNELKDIIENLFSIIDDYEKKIEERDRIIEGYRKRNQSGSNSGKIAGISSAELEFSPRDGGTLSLNLNLRKK